MQFHQIYNQTHLIDKSQKFGRKFINYLRIKNQFVLMWSNNMNWSSRGHMYTIFKSNFGNENYLDNLLVNLRKFLA